MAKLTIKYFEPSDTAQASKIELDHVKKTVHDYCILSNVVKFLYYALIYKLFDSLLPAAVCQKACDLGKLQGKRYCLDKSDESLIGQCENSIIQGFLLVSLLWYRKGFFQCLFYFKYLVVMPRVSPGTLEILV